MKFPLVKVSVGGLEPYFKRFLYFKPSRKMRKTGMVYKVFRLKHLYCWIYDKNQTDKIVIFCIDRIGNMSFYEKEFRWH